MEVSDVTTQLLAMRMGATQQVAQIAIMKKAHEMDMALVNMVAEVAKSAPAPAGQGLVVDKRA